MINFALQATKELAPGGLFFFFASTFATHLLYICLIFIRDRFSIVIYKFLFPILGVSFTSILTSEMFFIKYFPIESEKRVIFSGNDVFIYLWISGILLGWFFSYPIYKKKLHELSIIKKIF